MSLKRSEALKARPRTAIAGLQPKTDELALLIQRREAVAMPLSASLTEDFTRVAVELADNGWMAAGWGGGAGAGVRPAPRPAEPARPR
ncbi:hypothetical protein D3C78_1516900 [compost metagenome]